MKGATLEYLLNDTPPEVIKVGVRMTSKRCLLKRNNAHPGPFDFPARVVFNRAEPLLLAPLRACDPERLRETELLCLGSRAHREIRGDNHRRDALGIVLDFFERLFLLRMTIHRLRFQQSHLN